MESRYIHVQCRLCLYKSECLSDIFDDNGRQGFTAAEIITDLLQIKVTRDDGYPQLVCFECLDKLMSFKQFKEKCQNARSKFEKELNSNVIFINVKDLARPSILAAALTTQKYVLRNERENKNIDTHEQTVKYRGENNASECGEVVKEGLEEFVSEKEVYQKPEDTIEEEYVIPHVAEIKEEELIISNSIEENLSMTSYQDDDKTIEEESIIPFADEIKEEESIICNSTTEKSSLTYHYQCNTMKQPRGTIFECNECKEKFVDMVNLNIHLKGHRENNNVFPCEICGRIFKLKRILSSHKRKHTGKNSHPCKERLFECDVCEKRFVRKCYLVSHKITHAGGGPYSCEGCGMRFHKKTNLLLHRKIHALRPFHCDYCNKKFVHKRSLDAHMVLHDIPLPFQSKDV